MPKKISFMSLVILIIAAIDNMRNLPSAALFGSSLIFFFGIAALAFLLPTALISAELSSAFPQHGGVYQWVTLAFGKRCGMAAIWLQWINTMVWYPSMLSFIVGTFAYLIDPELVHNRAYVVGGILLIFWGLTFINLRGLHASATVNNIFCAIGTMLPLILLIILGGVWYFSGQPMQIKLDTSTIIPPLSESTSWNSLIAIMASFLGIELSGVHVNDILHPQKNFPRAVLLATTFIFLSMLLGSLAIAFVLPAQDISLISGVMQLYSLFFVSFGLEWLTPIVTLLIVIGSTGTMINWIISPAKGLSHAAEYGFLPPLFVKQNKHGIAANVLIAQAILVSIFSVLFLFEGSVNSIYWFLTALSTELYMIMYILMFCAAIRLHYLYQERIGGFKIPAGSFGIWITVLFGLLGCLTTIVVSCFPPQHIDVGSPLNYYAMVLIGNLVTLTPLAFFFYYESKKPQPELVS